MAYVALDDHIRLQKSYQPDEILELGLTLQEWDGMLSPLFFLPFFCFDSILQDLNANTRP